MNVARNPASPGIQQSPGLSNIIYYDWNGILVTSRHLQVGRYCYELAHLDQLMHAEAAGRSTAPRLIMTFVAATIVIPAAGVLGPPQLLIVAIGAFVIAGLGLSIIACRRKRHHELFAIYDGRQVRLFSTDDRRIFGQVARATQRALEGRHAGSSRGRFQPRVP